MMNLKIKIKIKCAKHPKYNPEKQGDAGIKGACSECNRMLAIFKVATEMQRLAKDLKAMDEGV